MEDKGNFVQFISSPSASKTTWSMDSITEDVVTTCESCKAEARHSTFQLKEGFAFRHNTGCPFDALTSMIGKSRNDRGYDLAARLGSILEAETDATLVVSTLSLLSAVACQVAAEEADRSLDEMAEHFMSGFERFLPAAARTVSRTN